jgi:glycosyltransferase involved in cell wall biosynthesis
MKQKTVPKRISAKRWRRNGNVIVIQQNRENTMAKLSIIMPTYNSVARNGNGYLKDALTSLLSQTYADFELHILDNISTDETPDICRTFAEKDQRIKFKTDTEQRFPEAGITELANNVTTDYMMVANCDDLWNHYYVESLFDVLDANPEITLAYSNGTFVDHNNMDGNPLLPDVRFTYDDDMERNFCLSIQHRNVVPLLFGVFKSEAYQAILPYTPFDTITANVDNLFLAKFFLYGYKAKLYDKPLFHYRDRPRDLQPKKLPDMPENPALIWVYYVRHQLNFYKAVSKYIPQGKPMLKMATLDSCLRNLIPLLKWTIRDLAKDTFEESLLHTIYKKYETIGRLLFDRSLPALTEELYKDHYRKCHMLSEHILPYINSMLTPNTLIDATIDLVHEIQADQLQ